MASSFLLLFILEEINLSHPPIHVIVFLKPDVAGNSAIDVARTGDQHFWRRPYLVLKRFIPAFTTHIVGTPIACYGLFMVLVGWEYTIHI